MYLTKVRELAHQIQLLAISQLNRKCYLSKNDDFEFRNFEFKQFYFPIR